MPELFWFNENLDLSVQFSMWQVLIVDIIMFTFYLAMSVMTSEKMYHGNNER